MGATAVISGWARNNIPMFLCNLENLLIKNAINNKARKIISNWFIDSTVLSVDLSNRFQIVILMR